jgi:hypothetical protein
MDMESSAYVGYLVELVQEGKVSENLMMLEELKVKFEWGCSITHTSIVTKLSKRNGRKC